MEATFSVLKGYINCEISVLNGKVDLFIKISRETITKKENYENNNVEVFQENISFVEKELLVKNDILKSLMETNNLIN